MPVKQISYWFIFKLEVLNLVLCQLKELIYLFIFKLKNSCCMSVYLSILRLEILNQFKNDNKSWSCKFVNICMIKTANGQTASDLVAWLQSHLTQLASKQPSKIIVINPIKKLWKLIIVNPINKNKKSLSSTQ